MNKNGRISSSDKRISVVLDLVKVPMKGYVGVHGRLFHWNRPLEMSSVYVIQDEILPHAGP